MIWCLNAAVSALMLCLCRVLKTVKFCLQTVGASCVVQFLTKIEVTVHYEVVLITTSSLRFCLYLSLYQEACLLSDLHHFAE